MTSLRTQDDCQSNDDPNNSFPTAVESLRFPVDNSMRIIFTAYFNGFNVELRSTDEISILYHMGYFGKSSTSRSRPLISEGDGVPKMMRKRQFNKRSFWYKKFSCVKDASESDVFLKGIDELVARIIHDSDRHLNKDVVDLVSSESENSEDSNNLSMTNSFSSGMNDSQDVVVVVPNSDSEEDDYFLKMKPKCCVNQTKSNVKLLLTLEEAFFLSYGLGCLQVISTDNKILDAEKCWLLFQDVEPNFTAKYVVYHYFRSKGYVVKPGIKFGGDYLLYKEGPEIAHADYIVIINNQPGLKSPTDCIKILGQVRMAVTTVKDVLIAEVVGPVKGVQKFPEDLTAFSVHEIILNRKIPVEIKDDN